VGDFSIDVAQTIQILRRQHDVSAVVLLTAISGEEGISVLQNTPGVDVAILYAESKLAPIL
jgi:uracil phosphoribosyltransferase